VKGVSLVKAFELFACNGADINDTRGINALYSTNSSTSWEINNADVVIKGDSYANQLSGALDEAIVNVNNNAFGSGNTGLIANARIVQKGYVDRNKNSLKFIQIASQQTHVTVSGEYPGEGGCTSALGGYFEAPRYDPVSAELGAMAVYSDAAHTTVAGIRVVGSAINWPGSSNHYANIALTGSSSVVTDSVADRIQIGPAQHGNQTNSAFCP
jgi:hypothetical protein